MLGNLEISYIREPRVLGDQCCSRRTSPSPFLPPYLGALAVFWMPGVNESDLSEVKEGGSGAEMVEGTERG